MTPLQCIFGLHNSYSMIPQVSTPNLHSKNKPENMKAVLFFPLRSLADPLQHLPKHRNYEMLYQVFSFQWKVTIHGYQLSPIMSYPSLSVPFHELQVFFARKWKQISLCYHMNTWWVCILNAAYNYAPSRLSKIKIILIKNREIIKNVDEKWGTASKRGAIKQAGIPQLRKEMPETRYLHAHSQSSFISRPSKEFSWQEPGLLIESKANQRF